MLQHVHVVNWLMCYNHYRIPDLERPKYHPKRLFITRAVELEIRLAYHERIMKTLPERFLEPEVECVPEIAPGPEFEFESPRMSRSFCFRS